MLRQWTIASFITIAICAFLAVVAFWAAFGPGSALTSTLGGNNWGAGAFWRAIYAMVGFGCLGAILAETRLHWASNLHRQVASYIQPATDAAWPGK